jgi:hypothetical protein
MALHEVPEDGTTHQHAVDCPCGPQVIRRRRADGFMGRVFVHQARGPEDDDQDAGAQLPAGVARIMPGADPEVGPEAECGHVVVETEAGEWQHHEIPDDGAPHAPTSECGCGPQRDESTGHVVYVHADTEADQDDDGDWGGAQ